MTQRDKKYKVKVFGRHIPSLGQRKKYQKNTYMI